MTTLYTQGAFTELSPTAFDSYSTIQVSASDATSALHLGLSAAGTINFAAKLGPRSAEVDGSLGHDNITAGIGNDSLWGNSGNDSLTGDAGNDLLVGDWDDLTTTGNDVLYGGTGDDLLLGGLGNDSLFGGDGNDVFILAHANSGIDLLSGGSGSDSLFLTDFFDAGLGVFHLNRLVLDTSASTEALILDTRVTDHVEGTAGNDLIDLSGALLGAYDGSSVTDNRYEFRLLTGNDTYVGTAGNDVVLTSDGNDAINLGTGDDMLFVTDGNLTGDSYFGGAGFDILHLEGTDGTLQLASLALGVSSGFEALYTSATITGTAGNDVWDLSGMGLGFRLGNDELSHLLDGNDRVVLAQDMKVDGGGGQRHALWRCGARVSGRRHRQ